MSSKPGFRELAARLYVELIILSGRQLGANVASLAEITGLNSSNISRRYTSARSRLLEDKTLQNLREGVLQVYETSK